MKTLQLGTAVKHRVPSMMYHQSGIIVAPAGVRHGNRYFLVSYTDPTTKKTWQTAFWEQVLKIV
jgi:hypothetical protein